MGEQRHYQRIRFRSEADINLHDTAYRCDLVDLALQGALFRSERFLPINPSERAELSIFLPDSALRMNFTGELIHQRGVFYGFLFVSVDDVTMGHLRRLLELNFGDAEKTDAEFTQWLTRDRKN